MYSSTLFRFSAACGVLLGLSVAVPGAVEAFTGETTATSLVLGIGAVLGAPAVIGLHLRQSRASGRFGAFAYTMNMIGLGLFSSVAFTLNLVLSRLDDTTREAVTAGSTGAVLLAGAMIFVLGTILFGISMLRAGVLPRPAAAGYTIMFSLLALLAPLPDTLWISAIHVLAGASLIWLSTTLWTRPEPAGTPTRTAAVGVR